MLLDALVEAGGVDLLVAGDGPERQALERQSATLGLDGRVRFLGSVPRETVLRLFRAADASVLPSAWENFPHTVVEALAVGCPVIATAVGGVPEVVRDGENGLLVPPNDSAALARGDREVLLGDAPARAARGGRAGLGRGLLRAGGVRDDRGGAREGGVGMKKRLLMVGRSRYSASARRRRSSRSSPRSPRSSTCGCSPPRAAEAERTRASGSFPPSGRERSTDRRSTRSLPFRVARELRDFRPDAVLAQGAQEAALCVLGRTLARVPTKIVADIHGDPAAPTRLYGSRAAAGCSRPSRMPSLAVGFVGATA